MTGSRLRCAATVDQMEELAAKHVLLDIEVITLIALAIGVTLYAVIRRQSDDPISSTPHWDVYDLGLMFFPAIMFLMGPFLLVSAAGTEQESAPGDATPGYGALLFNLGIYVFVVMMVHAIVEWIRLRSMKEVFGLTKVGLPQIIIYSIVGGIFSVLVCVWLVGTFSEYWIGGMFDGLQEQAPVRSLQEAESRIFISLAVFAAVIGAPVAEEFLFRGYMYGALKNATGRLFATVVISLLFAVVHGNLPALLPLFVFSLILCAAYEMSGSLWVPVGLHAFFNGTNIVLMLTQQAVE